MLTQVDISNTIRTAIFHQSTLLTRITDKLVYGDKDPLDKRQFIVLTEWIKILDDYLNDNYDQDGTITPMSDCFDADDISELVAKVKVMVGNCKYPFTEDDTWDDDAYWDDADYWTDSVVWA